MPSRNPRPPYQKSDITITTGNLEEGFRSMCEKTSSSPSGRHIGQYKTLTRPEAPPWILAFHQLVFAFAIEFCCPPTRWCRALQVWLEKDPGSPKIHRLRIIQLLEADFNLLLKIIWGRRMVWHATQYHAFQNVPQFGSRPWHSCQSALLLKVLSYDYIRYHRLTAAILNNNAKGCYN